MISTGFPDNPTHGTTHTAPNTRNYFWDDSFPAWVPAPGSTWPSGIVGPAGPPSTVPGPPGPPNSLTVGAVTTGSPPQVTITGAAPNQTINFRLPAGGTTPSAGTWGGSTWGGDTWGP
jgi:hypothetical protein